MKVWQLKNGLIALLCLLMVTGSVAAKTNITMWLSGQPVAVNDWALKFQNEFNRLNPDINLSIELYAGVAATRDKLTVAIIGGVAPDIVYDSNNLMPQWMNNGVALPLDRYLTDWNGTSDLLPDMLGSLRFRGQTWGIPFSVWPIGDLYNLDVYAAGGVSLPNTWDELLTATKRLTQRNPDGTLKVFGYYAPLAPLNVYVDFEMMMQQLGTAMIDDDALTANLQTDEARRVLTMMRDLVQAGQDPRARYSGDIAPLLNDQHAMFRSYGGFSFATMPETSKQLAFRRYVGPTADKSAIMGNGGILYITSVSPHPDEAWRVIEAFMEPENLKGYYLANTSVLPIRRSMFNDRDILARPWAQEQMATLSPPILPYGSRHVYNIDFRIEAANFFLSAMRGDISIEEALLQAQQVTDAIVADRKAAEQR
ncbi:MAG TPA: extracellular solute-binding protein [Firmicutes bacterium]|jgi:ABC-type glycerol-3-phosphate transport system substrate-binding protein|nr:extracellular solute-binding protein [Bacillota bacterium]